MTNGLVVMKDGEFLSRKSAICRQDERGLYWSHDIQLARRFTSSKNAMEMAMSLGGICAVVYKRKITQYIEPYDGPKGGEWRVRRVSDCLVYYLKFVDAMTPNPTVTWTPRFKDAMMLTEQTAKEFAARYRGIAFQGGEDDEE